MPEPARVLVVDDHPLFRQGVRALLASAPDFEVVGEASDGREALRKVAELAPTAVVMDYQMEGLDGLEATRAIKSSHPGVVVVLFTVSATEEFLVQAIRAGAAGYVLKGSSRDLLLSCLRTTVGGGNVFPIHLVEQALGKRPTTAADPEEQLHEPLTERERQVLELLAGGHKDRSIAETLGVATVTAKKHVQSILAKMQVSDRTQAAVKAYRLGLVD